MVSDHKIPGHLIESLLAARGLSQKSLAVAIGCDSTTLSRIIAGKRPLDAEMAIVIAEALEGDAAELLRLQRDFDLAQARLKIKADPTRSARARVFSALPIKTLSERGWISVANLKNQLEVEQAICCYFGVDSLDTIDVAPHAAKKTDSAGNPTLIQLAWLHRVRTIAAEMLVPPFSVESARAVLPKLQRLLLSADEVRHVPRILMEAGIRFLIVETLPGAKIDGVCTWLDEVSPVIGMSMRYDRIDNFWFVLRHEIEHVLLGHGKIKAVVDDLDDSDLVSENEIFANDAAADFCVPKRLMDSFVARKAPYFYDRDIVGFAAVNKIHPGLVAGQIQRRTQRYDRFRSHQVKVRSIISPSATLDGWGDIAPVDAYLHAKEIERVENER